MTKYILILVSLFTLCFTSCKKEPKLHKIKYVAEFIQTPDYGYSDWIEVGVLPCYQTQYNYGNQHPSITPNLAKNNKYWEYEYWELVNGDKVKFFLWTSEGYYFTIKIYIDNVEVSYKKLYGTTVVEKSGLGVDGLDIEIDFLYQE